MSTRYYFVIDTDAYAGNFEREMCAYVTGSVGDCGVGDGPAKVAKKELDQHSMDILDDILAQVADEHGCYRPVKIYPTPGYYNNGLGFEYQEGEEELAKQAYRKSCLEEARKDYYKDDSANEAHRREWLQKADEANIGKYPSYQSVAIIFYDKPPEELMDVMKKRAQKFAAASRNDTLEECGSRRNWVGPINIIGFRMVTEETTVTAEEEVL